MTDFQDARKPDAMLRLLNPVMRSVLGSPLGRVVKPFALLEFEGRRTGRHYRIPAGWHEGIDGRVVVTPAAWRANFVDGRDATVTFQGRTGHQRGTLDCDAEAVAKEVNAMIDGGLKPSLLSLKVAPGYQVTAEDMRLAERCLIRFK